MRPTSKVALFLYDFNSLTGTAIAIATKSWIVHAAVCVDGGWWHSSEKINRFDKVDVQAFENRLCLIFEVEGCGKAWLEKHMGTRYDWLGIFGWFIWWMIGKYLDRFIVWKPVNHFFSATITGGYIRDYIRKVLYIDNDKDFFCFETALDMLGNLGYTLPDKPYSGQTVLDVLDRAGLFGHFGMIKDKKII